MCIAVLATWPALTQETSSGAVKERLRAIERLKEQGRKGLPQLGQYLRDPEVRVRREAVQAIVQIGTADSLDLLIEATRDPDPEVQIWATDGLVNFYLPGYVKTGITVPFRRLGAAIKARFSEENDQVVPLNVQVREDVVRALGRVARGGTSMEARANAARAVGILRGRAAVDDLVEALRSKDTRVMYEALVALQKIRDLSAGPRIRYLIRDPDERIRVKAIETLGLLRDYGALPELREVLSRARSRNIERAALSAVAMLPNEQNRPLLESYLTHQDPELRAAAAEGLGRLGNPQDATRLEQLFNSERKMNPRLSLAFALVKLGRTDLSEFSPLRYLINTLNQSSFKSVARALLIELAREAKIRQSIYQALSSGTKEEKIELADILGLSGGTDTISPLEQLSRDPDPAVSTAALKALAVLRARLSSGDKAG